MRNYLSLALEEANLDVVGFDSNVKPAKSFNFEVALEHYSLVCKSLNILKTTTVSQETADVLYGQILELDVPVNTPSLESFSDSPIESMTVSLENIKVSMENGFHDWILETFKGPIKHLEKASIDFTTVKTEALSLLKTAQGTISNIEVTNRYAIVPQTHGKDTLFKAVEHADIANRLIYKDYSGALAEHLIEVYTHLLNTSQNTAWVYIRRSLWYALIMPLSIIGLAIDVKVEVNKFTKQAETIRNDLIRLFGKAPILGGGVEIQSTKNSAFPIISTGRSLPSVEIKGLSDSDVKTLLTNIVKACDSFLHIADVARENITKCRKATEHAWDEEAKTNAGIFKTLQRFWHYCDSYGAKPFVTGGFYKVFAIGDTTANNLKAVLSTLKHL